MSVEYDHSFMERVEEGASIVLEAIVYRGAIRLFIAIDRVATPISRWIEPSVHRSVLSHNLTSKGSKIPKTES